jgi:prepilin-type processing-associated H-X9-DG protein
MYNILPFMELDALHQIGAGMPDITNSIRAIEKRRNLMHATRQPVAAYHCPSRRPAIAYTYWHGDTTNYLAKPYFNVLPVDTIAKTDYAANGGSGTVDCNIAHMPEDPLINNPDGVDEATWDSFGGTQTTGVIYQRSVTEFREITDGASSTYLLGEKQLNPDEYAKGTNWGDDQGWNLGYDLDITRWTNTPPLQDISGLHAFEVFGSAHPSGVHMAFCDGSVHKISYKIDAAIHRELGGRGDGNRALGKDPDFDAF